MVPQKELRNDVGAVLRRAEGGEEIVITVSGRPVAALGPLRNRQWVPSEILSDIDPLESGETLIDDLRGFDATLGDPWRAKG